MPIMRKTEHITQKAMGVLPAEKEIRSLSQGATADKSLPGKGFI
jgi:hypothetical protein